jgi:hypothetical protein
MSAGMKYMKMPMSHRTIKKIPTPAAPAISGVGEGIGVGVILRMGLINSKNNVG